jgi:hypothetical protein
MLGFDEMDARYISLTEKYKIEKVRGLDRSQVGRREYEDMLILWKGRVIMTLRMVDTLSCHT